MRRNYNEHDVRKAVANSKSIAGVLRLLNLRPVGGNYKTIKHLIEKYSLDTRHFTGQGWNVGLKFKPKVVTDIADILIKGSHYQSYKLKSRLLREGLKERRCECCGLEEWQGKPIPLELHHINGNKNDLRLCNLQILCPNCHTFTTNYRKRKSALDKSTT